MRRRRRLGDLLAAPARVLLAHVLDHLPLPGHQLQRLGDVLAQLVQRPAAARADRRHRIDHAFARQVLGQRPTRGLAPLERRHRHALWRGDLFRRLRLSLSFFQLEQLQLELIDQRAVLRRLAELLMLQLGDPLLELLDLQRLVSNLLAIACRSASSIAFSVSTSSESRCRIVSSHQPATCGRSVRCGSRQSMPCSR